MADDLMRYDLLEQEALRGVVRSALMRAASSEGLPGEHHFYITFKTTAADVEIPPDLLERYPDEMTIVLKTRFWDLSVEEAHFAVNLTFNGVPARLSVPYRAITRFFDPTVPFRLQFMVDVPPPPARESVDVPTPDAPSGGEVLSLDAFRKR